MVLSPLLSRPLTSWYSHRVHSANEAANLVDMQLRSCSVRRPAMPQKQLSVEAKARHYKIAQSDLRNHSYRSAVLRYEDGIGPPTPSLSTENESAWLLRMHT